MQHINKIQKKKIMFIIPSLVGGGAERVMMNLITHLERSRYDISLVLFEKKGKYLSSIPAYTKVYDLKRKNIYSYVKLVFLLTGIIWKTKPNTVVSFLDYSNMITTLARLLSFRKCNLIISVRCYLYKEDISRRFKRISFIVYKILSKCANYVIVNSTESGNQLTKLFNLSSDKIRVIYNPLDIEKIDKLKVENADKTILGEYVLAVGRLAEGKGFSYLLRAYALAKENLNEKLVILGEGHNEQKLKSLSADLRVQEKVLFLGFQENPYKFMKNAKIFILSSLVEGFPNVLIEAMACGVPVIATNCASGPGEIITNQENGILVPPADEKALAAALVHLHTNNNLRMKFSETGRKRAEDFRIGKILPLYEELFH